jgi:outer membrane protein assembly factor BamB
MGYAGPRATPTVFEGRVYTQGATGIVHCLDATNGKVIWSVDTSEKFGADNLVWGKSGSPLVIDDLVVVNVGAPEDATAQESYSASLVAFDRETGEVRWTAGNRVTAYASPVLATIQGERQILQLNQDFLTSHRATDGKILWEHPWPGNSSSNATCPQPIPLTDDRLLLCKGYGIGASLLQVAKVGDDYAITPLWQQEILPVLKTKFANVVLRDGYVYGLDGTMLQCVELESGEEQWKKRRSPDFGHGEIMLIGDAMLVLSEQGELVLVEATPEEYRELGSLQALSDEEITWNNPAFSSPYLLVRNSREAVCYRLPLAESPSP